MIGTVVGKSAKVGKKCHLVDCVVRGAVVVEDGTEGKGESFMGGEGLEEGASEGSMDEDGGRGEGSGEGDGDYGYEEMEMESEG